ncbi:MAG: FAD-dependent oxidoreductase [Pseudoflavonifractor sp.]|nr:FAD-dependent oxidoreductase [Pseudoflavonifractor sp.]
MGINPISALSDNIRVDTSKCIGCGTCVERCTLDNLRLEQAPCGHACPLGINAQGYVQLIHRGDLEGAAEQIYKKTPFMGLLGRICNHPCEKKCNHNQVDGTGVSIRALKRYLYEHTPDGPDVTVVHHVSGRCAIVGGGPAGMSAAWVLAKEGCQVTLFEENHRLGGTLARAVPSFRLPDEVVESECALLTKVGVEVRTGIRIGRDIQLEQLAQDYDAVFLATGATLPVEVAQAKGQEGVEYALDFLARAKEGPVSVAGPVLVVGGGDVAIDAAMTARRAGASQVTILSLEQMDQLPASEESITEAGMEGITFQPGWGIGSILEQNGKTVGLRVKQCVRVFDSEGRFAPCYDENITRDVSADKIILAIGQKTRLDYLCPSVAQERGRISVHPVSLQTTLENVFAGGDAVPGPNTAVHAMADGVRAAESILRLLNGDDLTYGRDSSLACIHDFPVDLTAGGPDARVDLLKSGGETVERSMSDEEAKCESGRCLNCGRPIGYRRTCWMCLPCEVECPQKALEVGIHYVMA